MSPSTHIFAPALATPGPLVREEQIEYGVIGKLQGLKYEYRADIRDRTAPERNFREKFEALNRVKLSDGQFARLLDEIVTPDVLAAARTLRSINSFTRMNFWRENVGRSSSPTAFRCSTGLARKATTAWSRSWPPVSRL